MKLLKRVLAAGGAAGLLVGVGGATQAFAVFPLTVTVQTTCATAGTAQTITVHTGAAALVHVEVSVTANTASGATQNVTGLADASGNFKDQWTLGAASAVTTATIRVWVLADAGVLTASDTFLIYPANSPCPSPSTHTAFGSFVDVTQVGGNVQKTCDAGVSGTAVFAPTIQIHVSYDSHLTATVVLPASLNLSLVCNGPSKALPVLPPTSVITLHESTRPTGAAAAADTSITIGTAAATTTIHNAKAAVVVTPTPTAIVLPPTGQPASTPSVAWLAIALMGLLGVGAGAGLALRRRS